jgi:hypothetical protein
VTSSSSDPAKPVSDTPSSAPEPDAEQREAPATSQAPPAGDEPVVAAKPPKPASGVRRFFLMEERLRQAKTEVFQAGQPRFQEFLLARSLADCARAMLDFPERQDGALLLMRDSAELALRARVARSGAVDSSSMSREALWNAFASLREKQPWEALSEAQRELVRQTLTEGSNETLAALDAEQRKARTKAMARFLPPLVVGLQEESERVAQVRAVRAFRIGGTLVLLIAVLIFAGSAIARALRGENVALGKPVTISSNWDVRRFPASSIVDGDTDALGCHTQQEQRPWVQIDLGRPVGIREVAVHNRQEYSERAVPLIIEVSLDGKRYQVFDRREQDFDLWKSVKEQPVEARFVRLTIPKRNHLHLNEVQVYTR